MPGLLRGSEVSLRGDAPRPKGFLMSDQIAFYTNPQSRGRIARWMLEEVGVPYETRVLDYGEAMKSHEYLAINPMGKVPCIVHGDEVVTECAAICAYLADAFPEAGLVPSKGRGAYYRWLMFAAGPLEAAIIDRALGVEIPADRERMVGYGNFMRVMDVLESAVSVKHYIAGESFSAADVYVGSHIDFGLTFESIDKRPAFEEYVSRLRERPAFKRASELDDALVPDQGS